MKCWHSRGLRSRRNAREWPLGTSASVLSAPPNRRNPGRRGRLSCVLTLVARPIVSNVLISHQPRSICPGRGPSLPTREGVMVVVPAFAHADQTSEPDIVALGSHAIDDPALAAPSMGEMADQPVAGDADADPREDPQISQLQPPTRRKAAPRAIAATSSSFHRSIEAVVAQAAVRAGIPVGASSTSSQCNCHHASRQKLRRWRNSRGIAAGAAPSHGNHAMRIMPYGPAIPTSMPR